MPATEQANLLQSLEHLALLMEADSLLAAPDSDRPPNKDDTAASNVQRAPEEAVGPEGLVVEGNNE
jgi:hypothetical protein